MLTTTLQLTGGYKRRRAASSGPPYFCFIQYYSTFIHLHKAYSVDSLDWKDLSAAEITKRVTSKVQPGSIVLFHNAALHTPEALPDILQTLIQDGYTFVPISQILLNCEYTIDHTERQCPASES